jgi:hypothetical protein
MRFTTQRNVHVFVYLIIAVTKNSGMKANACVFASPKFVLSMNIGGQAKNLKSVDASASLIIVPKTTTGTKIFADASAVFKSVKKIISGIQKPANVVVLHWTAQINQNIPSTMLKHANADA